MFPHWVYVSKATGLHLDRWTLIYAVKICLTKILDLLIGQIVLKLVVNGMPDVKVNLVQLFKFRLLLSQMLLMVLSTNLIIVVHARKYFVLRNTIHLEGNETIVYACNYCAFHL